jgi:hypothetical protein
LLHPSLSDDDQEDFNKAMAQLPFPNFSVLDLDILAEGHVFGPVVLHLLRIQPAIQMLKISMEENRQPKVHTQQFFPQMCLCCLDGH